LTCYRANDFLISFTRPFAPCVVGNTVGGDLYARGQYDGVIDLIFTKLSKFMLHSKGIEATL